MVGKDDVALRGDDGRYSPLIAFESRQVRDRFSLAVIDALRRAHPGVFDEVAP
jgi:hypothetical protein